MRWRGRFEERDAISELVSRSFDWIGLACSLHLCHFGVSGFQFWSTICLEVSLPRSACLLSTWDNRHPAICDSTQGIGIEFFRRTRCARTLYNLRQEPNCPSIFGSNSRLIYETGIDSANKDRLPNSVVLAASRRLVPTSSVLGSISIDCHVPQADVAVFKVRQEMRYLLSAGARRRRRSGVSGSYLTG